MHWPWKCCIRAPAVADLHALQNWFSPLLQKLDGRGRAQLARKAAQQLRRSQQQRIRAQVNPCEARKPRDLRGEKGRLKRRMFEKLKMAWHLKAKGTPQRPVIGFAGRVSCIARVHQYGLTDRAERGAPKVRYARREVLGLSDQDLHTLRDLLLDQLDI